MGRNLKVSVPDPIIYPFGSDSSSDYLSEPKSGSDSDYF